MSTPEDQSSQNGSSGGQTPEEIQAEIETQRVQLAHTVDQLGEKLDVKSRARDKAQELRDRATTDTGAPRPELLVAAGSFVAVFLAVAWWRRRS